MTTAVMKSRNRGVEQEAAQAARNEMIVEHLPLVKQALGAIAAHLPAHVDREDLLEAGMIGLVDAANRFDPARNVKFSTYAVARIRGAMLDALRDADWLPRSMRSEVSRIERARQALEHEKSGPATTDEICRTLRMSKSKIRHVTRCASSAVFASLDETSGSVMDIENNGLHAISDRFSHPAERVLFDEEREILAQMITRLPPNERLVISLYYFEELNLREIAETLGVTNSRVCQIHRGALQRLQKMFNAAERPCLAAAI